MTAGAVNLYWLPLGAGGNSVRFNGRVYEAVVAAIQRRTPQHLYHSALEVELPAGRYVVEMTPVENEDSSTRGVVAEGAVASRALASFRLFRYEVRRWHDGVIPDIAEAVDSPRRLTEDVALAKRILELVPQVPTLVWGRDELRVHDMWNSNSLVSWLLARSGVAVNAIQPPVGGRAPGWKAGVAMAQRQQLGGSP